MYKVNIEDILLPANIEELFAKEVENQRGASVGKTTVIDQQKVVIDSKLAKVLIPDIAFDKTDQIKRDLLSSIDSYLQGKYWVESRNLPILPLDIRKLVTKVRQIIMSVGDSIELSNDQFNFLREVMTSDLAPSHLNVYIAEYLVSLSTIE